MKVTKNCPCCNLHSDFLRTLDGYNYYICTGCRTIFIDPVILGKMDNMGDDFNLVCYDRSYWVNELASAKERAYGVALARMSEAVYYSRIPIKKFLDIGTGPGYFLDAIGKYLPNHKDIFYGIEKYPPPEEYRTKSRNYILTDYEKLPFKVDAGLCMEVAEHLTPEMFKDVLKKIAKASNDGALYIFNTGMSDYVLKEDDSYLDPKGRGHIISYSLQGVQHIAENLGFTVFPLPGKTWAFVLEYNSKSNKQENIKDRIWTALKDNLKILEDKEMGSVLKVLGLETSRAYD